MVAFVRTICVKVRLVETRDYGFLHLMVL